MNLNSIFNDFCATLKNVKETSKTFADLQTDEERFEMAHHLSREYLYNLNVAGVGKCASTSKQVREIGNEHFQKKMYWESLEFYSKSLAFAPKGSEESVLALGNRSACLLKLDFPDEALNDIEKAISMSEDSAYKSKLLSRKEKCREQSRAKHLNDSNLETSKIPSLSRGKSDFFDSASLAVKLCSNEALGRHLITSEDVKTGEVLIVEKPFSSVLLPHRFYTHCANCFCKCVQLLPCDYCSTSMYCSKKCLNGSLNQSHKVECAILNVLTNLKAWRMELLALRILLETSKQGENLEILFKEVSEYNNNNENNNGRDIFCGYDSTKHSTAYNLMGNTSKRSVADLFYRALVVSVLVVLLEKHTNFFKSCKEEDKEKLKRFSGGLMLRYMQSLPCNAHEIFEFNREGLSEIGAGLYSTLSLINHSCDPNVVRHCYGDVVVLRSIRPIGKNQEIVDNYGYHYATHRFDERQASLSKQYYFDCRCRACEELWPLYEELPDGDPIFKPGTKLEIYEKLTQSFKEHLEAIFKGTFDFDIIHPLCRYLDFLDAHVEQPWKPFNKCQEAIKYCLGFYANRFRALVASE